VSHRFPIASAVAALAAVLVLTHAPSVIPLASSDAGALPPSVTPYESTARVLSTATQSVTLRFEIDGTPGEPPSAVANQDAPLTVVRYAGHAEPGSSSEGRTWRATSSAPGPFTVLVRVPDRGAIEWDVERESVDGADPVGSPSDAAAADQRSLVEVSEPAIMRDIRVVRVTFLPSGTASERRETRALTLTLRATGRAGANEKDGRHPCASAPFGRLYRSSVINYVDDGAPVASVPAAGEREEPTGARYLIVTDHIYEDSLEPLVAWKDTKGLRPKVVNLFETGMTADDIRLYIQNAYDTWDVPPEYVLLVGDTEVLPPFHALAVTDNYFATVEGTDYVADLFVGRLPADSVSECETMIAKILAYERPWTSDDPAWPMSASLLLRDDFDMGDMIYYDNTWFIHDLMEAHGFDPIDLLFHADGITNGDTYASLNTSKGFVNYRGIAGDFWPEPFSIAPTSLTNGINGPIVVSATCLTGAYDDDVRLSEWWLRAGTPADPTGGVAFFGTSTHGQGPELSRKRGYIDEAFFANAMGPGRTLGEACLAGKLEVFTVTGDQWEYEGWNLLGDPDLSIWTAVPESLAASRELVMHDDHLELTVTVSNDREAVAGAFVTCQKPHAFYLSSETDGAGGATFVFDAALPCTLRLTATGKNAVPLDETVVVAPQGPYPTFAEATIDDSEGGNGDGFLSPGESASVSICLTNIGSAGSAGVQAVLRSLDPYASVTDSVASFGDMASGATECGDVSYGISVADDWPGGYHLPIALAIAHDGSLGLCRPTPLPTVSGALTAGAASFDDGGPGGDGDGRIEPGESAGMILELRNASGAALSSITGTLSSADPYVSVVNDLVLYADAPAGSLIQNASEPFVVSVSPGIPPDHEVTLSLRVDGEAPTYAYAESLDIALDVSTALTSLPSGPDAYGYYAYDSTDTLYREAPIFEWIDIAPPGPGGRIPRVSDADDDVKLLPTGFTVGYYGLPVTWMVLCTNGFVSLEMTNFVYGTNSPIPSILGPPNMIAPFWGELDPSAGGDVYVWQDVTGGRIVIQYENVRHKNSSDAETFQVVIYDPFIFPTPSGDSKILFQYESVSQSDSCTVGIESPSQLEGVGYLYDGGYDPRGAPLDDGLAILFTTAAPETLALPWIVLRDVTVDDSEGGNGNAVAEPGETVALVVELANDGLGAATDVVLALATSDSSIALADTTASLPDMEPGGSATNGASPFTLTVSEELDDSSATLWLRVGGSAGAHQRALRLDLDLVRPTPVASRLALSPCYPNPFNDGTRVRLTLPERRDVTLRVYDVAGRLVRTVWDAPLDAGPRELDWDGRDADGRQTASGVYFVRLRAGDDTRTRKVVVLR